MMVQPATQVYVEVVGSQGSSGQLALSAAHQLARPLPGQRLFARAQSDTFLLQLRDVGELQQLVVWHDCSGPAPAWHLDYGVACWPLPRGKLVYFVCGGWLAASEPGGWLAASEPGGARRVLQVGGSVQLRAVYAIMVDHALVVLLACGLACGAAGMWAGMWCCWHVGCSFACCGCAQGAGGWQHHMRRCACHMCAAHPVACHMSHVCCPPCGMAMAACMPCLCSAAAPCKQSAHSCGPCCT
jgi:hypothetical protein